MAFNESKGKLYISLPEQGKIVEANVSSKKLHRSLAPSQHLMILVITRQTTTLAQFNLAVDSISHRLFVFTETQTN